MGAVCFHSDVQYLSVMNSSPASLYDPKTQPWVAELIKEAGLSSNLRLAQTPNSANQLSGTEIFRVFDGRDCVGFAKRHLGEDAQSREASEIEACLMAASVFAGHEGIIVPDVLAVRQGGGFLLRAVPGVPANLAISRDDRALRCEQIRRIGCVLGIFHRSQPVSMAPYTLGERVLRLTMRLNHLSRNTPNWAPRSVEVTTRLGSCALAMHDSITGDMRPQTIQHGDPIPLNIVMSPHHIGLVDFEFCGRTWQVNDAAILLDRLTTSCPFEQAGMNTGTMFDPVDARAFAGGYGEDPTAHREFVIFACFELLARILAAAEAQQKEPLVLLQMAERALKAH